jgi:hypothetical protein
MRGPENQTRLSPLPCQVGMSGYRPFRTCPQRFPYVFVEVRMIEDFSTAEIIDMIRSNLEEARKDDWISWGECNLVRGARNLLAVLDRRGVMLVEVEELRRIVDARLGSEGGHA